VNVGGVPERGLRRKTVGSDEGSTLVEGAVGADVEGGVNIARCSGALGDPESVGSLVGGRSKFRAVRADERRITDGS